MTQEQNIRLIQALAETKVLLANEMRYSPDLRKQDRLAFYHAHIAKITAAMAA